jgi:hypothetical protein
VCINGTRLGNDLHQGNRGIRLHSVRARPTFALRRVRLASVRLLVSVIFVDLAEEYGRTMASTLTFNLADLFESIADAVPDRPALVSQQRR